VATFTRLKSGSWRVQVRRKGKYVNNNYANDKKIDVVPCLTDRTKAQEVCNRTANRFEQSEPKQYTDWLMQQNSYSGSNSFRKVT
jgi:hypothetical protein